jgi:hypothetical protein
MVGWHASEVLCGGVQYVIEVVFGLGLDLRRLSMPAGQDLLKHLGMAVTVGIERVGPPQLMTRTLGQDRLTRRSSYT